jgi:PAS domain S-box-containing protein
VTESSQDQSGQDRFAHSALLNAMPDAIVIVDPEGRIVGFNSMAQAMFGYDRKDVLGQSVELLMPDQFRGRHVDERQRYTQVPHVRPMGSERNLLARHKDGREFTVEISLAPFQTPEGALVVSVIRAVAGRRGASD